MHIILTSRVTLLSTLVLLSALLSIFFLPGPSSAAVLLHDAPSFRAHKSLDKTPVILIPGDGGSQMEARLDGKPAVPHYWCSKSTKDYFPIWLNLELLTYFTIDCFIDNFRLVFDNVTRLSSNAPNVSIRVPGYGDTTAVEYFDASCISASAYFSALVTALLAEGYVKNVSVRGAPFDFRRSPVDLPTFDADLLALIEETRRLNGGSPVLLVAHSYGNSLVLRFLQRQSDDWKQQNVRAWVAVGAPIGGAVKTAKVIASGDTLSIPFENPTTVRPLQRSFTSSAFLVPNPALWPATETFASRPGRNYSTADYADFFADMGFPDGELMRQAGMSEYDPTTPPGVEVHCVHGNGLATPGQLVWSSDQPGWSDAQPSIVSDNGDGTVNERSLKACKTLWDGRQGQPVHSFIIEGAEHVKILRSDAFINYTLSLIKSFETPPPPSRARNLMDGLL